MKRIYKVFAFLIVLSLSSCAPAVFKSVDASGNLLDISGTWEGIGTITSIYVKSQYGDSSVSITGETKKLYANKFVFTMEKSKKTDEIIGNATHYYISSSNTYNEYDYGVFNVSGKPESASWTYYRNTDGESETVRVQGLFRGNEFVGTLEHRHTIRVRTVFQDGRQDISEQTTNETYSIKLLQRKVS